jgi:hypothetical protein
MHSRETERTVSNPSITDNIEIYYLQKSNTTSSGLNCTISSSGSGISFSVDL